MLTSCKQQQVCENNWVRRISAVKRLDKRRMEELKEPVMSRLKWTRHVERMEGERLTKRGDTRRTFVLSIFMYINIYLKLFVYTTFKYTKFILNCFFTLYLRFILGTLPLLFHTICQFFVKVSLRFCNLKCKSWQFMKYF